MKKYILYSALSLAMLGWSACQEESELASNVAVNGKTLTFTASVSDGNSLSKTAVSANGTSIVFEENESMTVVPNVGNAFTISNSAADVNFFSGVAGDEAYWNATRFVAMYPSGALENGEFVMTIPQEQTVVSGSFDPQANLLIAEASSEAKWFVMYNVCSYIRVNIGADASYIKVSADQPLAGKVSVDPDGSSEIVKGENTVTLSGNITPGAYYIAVMPGKVSNLKITTDNKDFKPIEVAEFEFERGKIHGVGMGRVVLLSPADIVPYVYASEDEIVTLNMPLDTYDENVVQKALQCIKDKKVDLVIPDGVTRIGNGIGFYDCRCLASVTIPESVSVIGSLSFYLCDNLSHVTIPVGVTEIGSQAFGRCESLTSVSISESVTVIGQGAFEYCPSLSSITIPEGVAEIGYNAFENTSITNINIPKSVKNWGEYQFENGHLTSITIPDGVTEIGSYAFGECYELTSITIPETVTEIGSKAFIDCYNLTSITIPEGVTVIEDYAFYVCNRLTNITIPESVTKIGEYAFRYCRNLASITIPEGVTEIGEGAFYDCDNLLTIYCSQYLYDKYHEWYPEMLLYDAKVDNSYTQITFQKQYAAMNFTPEDDYESVVFEFEEQPYELQVTITSDLFDKEESWGDAYYAAYYPTQYFMSGNKLSLNLIDVFNDNFAGLVNDRGETASKITTIAIQNAADGENVVYLKRVVFVKKDGSRVVLKNSEEGFDFVMEVIE